MTITALVTGIACFVAGYITGRLDSLLGVLRSQPGSAPQGFSVKNNAAPPRAAISIDERKVVTDIKTDTLAKTQDIQLGKQVVAADDIHASVNKLAQLKRS